MPASDLVFVCPMREWGMVDPVKQGNIYIYQFRDIMPADLTGLMGDNYARCFSEVSCHAADLSFMFELERRINCTFEGKYIDANIREKFERPTQFRMNYFFHFLHQSF